MEGLQHPVNRFRLVYARQLFSCHAQMFDTWYRIYFNRRPVAELAMNDDMEWMLTAGTILPDEVVTAIGRKIESRYR